MELFLKRKEFSQHTTIGELFIDEQFFCFVLEDFDRGLKQDMLPELIEKGKVYGKTCIPYGKYEIIMSWSNKFKCIMPLVSHVPGYEGIRIHKGNTEFDTLGCLLVAMEKGKDKVMKSTQAFDKIYPLLEDACKKGKVFITIEKAIENVIYQNI